MKQRIVLVIGISLLVLAVGVFTWRVNARTLSDSGILLCEVPPESAFRADLAAVDHRARLTGLLATSGAPDMQAIAIARKFSDSNPAAFDALLDFSERTPDSAFAALLSLRHCSANVDNPGCNNALIERTIALEGDNAVVPALVASLRYAQGDEFGAAAALRAAGIAPRFDDYVSSLMGILHTAVEPVSDVEAPQILPLLLTESVQLAPLNYTGIRPLLEMCSTQVADNPVLANSCQVFAQRVIGNSRTLIGTQLGYALLGLTLSGVGDRAGAQRTETEARAALNILRGEDQMSEATRLMSYDADLMRNWLDTIANSNERMALQSIVDEAVRRSAEPDYNPCPPMSMANLSYRLRRVLDTLL